MMFDDAQMDEYYSPSSIAAEAAYDYVDVPSWKHQIKSGKGRGKSSKRRFSDEQIRSLESIFELETRLDPGKKMEVARELGLQPRQVAIWFQNKRARWKSKQLEHDFAALKADYAQLASRLESLKKEKHALISQLAKLKTLIGKGAAAAATSVDVDHSGEEDETVLLKMEPPAAVAATASAPALSLSDDEISSKAERCLGLLEEDEYHHHNHQEDSQGLMMSMDLLDRGGSLTSARHGPSLSLNPDELLNPSSPIQWWDFWS